VADALTAYTAAKQQGLKLARTINAVRSYKYVHFVAHSAGARLTDVDAKKND
jgi:hypothetical protein